MGKRPVCFGEGIAPYCPNCRSGEYLYNEDGAANNYCGQCGCELDWDNRYNEDTEQIERKCRCRDCINYEYSTSSHQICKAKGIKVERCKPACKKYFKARIVKFPQTDN